MIFGYLICFNLISEVHVQSNASPRDEQATICRYLPDTVVDIPTLISFLTFQPKGSLSILKIRQTTSSLFQEKGSTC